jgi:hypothetical protein
MDITKLPFFSMAGGHVAARGAKPTCNQLFSAGADHLSASFTR